MEIFLKMEIFQINFWKYSKISIFENVIEFLCTLLRSLVEAGKIGLEVRLS